jgi:radical SAM superfamily enzyme YgiQ (UPF0313 family)
MQTKVFLADLTHTGCGISARTFPLGIGCIATFAKQELGDQFSYELFKFPTTLNARLNSSWPRIMCFSNFVWNARLTNEFARQIKSHSPETVIIFGGPNFPLTDEARREYMHERPYIDFYIKWDGEIAFVELLRALQTDNFDADALKRMRPMIPNLCYLSNGAFIEGPDQRVLEFSTLPSPYLAGTLDEFFSEDLDILFETNRGCPYSCTFCNDGHQMRNKVFRKPHDLIQSELEYIRERVNPTADLHLADLNYGMYKDDLETSRIIRSMIDKYGWPNRIFTSVGKSHSDRVLEATDIINGEDEGIFRFGASFQSTDKVVLKAIKRKNVSMTLLGEIRDFKSPSFRNLEFFTELIVPLPEDTVDTHTESLRKCADDLHMNNFEVHQLTLLPGTEMAEPTSRSLYEFDVRYRVYVACAGIYDVLGKTIPCAEIEEVVVGTRTMSFDGYLECRVVDLLVKLFIDRDPFEEVFGLVEWLSLSPFAVILSLKESNFTNPGPLTDLIDWYIEATKAPLDDSLEQILVRTSRIAEIQKYIDGELGKNELLAARSTAFLHYQKELHQALEHATISYLKKEGCLTPMIEYYIQEACRFSEYRKFDPSNYKGTSKNYFDFDFLQAQEARYQINPDSIHSPSTALMFKNTNESIHLINRQLSKWTTKGKINYNKFYQKENLKIMARHVYRPDD